MRRIVFSLAILLGFMTLSFNTPASAWAKESTLIKMTTSMGDIVIKLNEEKAPKTSQNFKQYVEEGFYDGTIFHRVINGFMIQGGGMDESMQPKDTHAPVANEADNGLKNSIYTVAMARTNNPHSATSQFFINVKDNAFLDHTGKSMQGWGYCVFGEVIEGQDIVDKIKQVPTSSKFGHDDVPVTPVLIEKAVILSK